MAKARVLTQFLDAICLCTKDLTPFQATAPAGGSVETGIKIGHFTCHAQV
jgi:hypothetical protein